YHLFHKPRRWCIMAQMRRWGYAVVVVLAAFALTVPAAAQQPPPGLPPLPPTPPPATPPPVALPEPKDAQVIDVPNDAGNQIAALWSWPGEVDPTVQVALEVKSTTDLLKNYELTEAQRNRLSRARE